MMCQCDNGCPVVIIPDSTQAPKGEGSGFYYTTPSGKTIVQYPKAYGWRTRYHPSTYRITVGANWTPRIPSGMQLETKGGTHLIRLSDKMDFHFLPIELYRKDFCSWARKEMASNYQKRLETRKMERIFITHCRNVFVTFTDARRAGNCVEGILNFAKRKLGIDKEELLIAPWLVQVPAKLLMRIDPHNQLVKNSISQAILRETAVSI